MRYLTATQAAERLHKSDKTIRRWIESGKLSAHHPAKNKLAIPESEIERLARELEQYEQEPPVDVHALASRVESLEQEVRELQASLSLMRGLSFTTATRPRKAAESSDGETTRTRRRGEAIAPDDLPAGTMHASDFAERHGVSPRTFRDHLVTGLKGDRVSFVERPKPGRVGEVERWLTPDQQQDVRSFWIRHNVKFTLPETPE